MKMTCILGNSLRRFDEELLEIISQVPFLWISSPMTIISQQLLKAIFNMSNQTTLYRNPSNLQIPANIISTRTPINCSLVHTHLTNHDIFGVLGVKIYIKNISQVITLQKVHCMTVLKLLTTCSIVFAFNMTT